jgi:hypothetical protein
MTVLSLYDVPHTVRSDSRFICYHLYTYRPRDYSFSTARARLIDSNFKHDRDTVHGTASASTQFVNSFFCNRGSCLSGHILSSAVIFLVLPLRPGILRISEISACWY